VTKIKTSFEQGVARYALPRRWHHSLLTDGPKRRKVRVLSFSVMASLRGEGGSADRLGWHRRGGDTLMKVKNVCGWISERVLER